MSPVLELRDVDVDYGRTRVVHAVSLAVGADERLALVGRSGSGKSSILRALLGLVIPRRGTVLIDGAVASEGGRLLMAPEARRLSVVFQDLALWPHMTAAENVAFALEARGVRKSERELRASAALAELGLTDKQSRYPHQLSGGEKQRVALARALVVTPIGLLLDEPLAGLDPLLKGEVLDLLKRTFEQRSTSTIYVTHDLREARQLAQRIAVMDAGQLAQVGTWQELSQTPANDVVRRLVATAS